MQDERLILIGSTQRQTNEHRSPGCRRGRKAEVLKIEAHGLLVLGQRVPHVSGPFRVRRIKVSKPALGFRLLEATGLDERRQRVGMLEPPGRGGFNRGGKFEGAPNQKAPIAFERPVQDAGQFVGHDAVEQLRVLVHVGESAVKRNDHQPAPHPVRQVCQTGNVVAQQDRNSADRKVEDWSKFQLAGHLLGLADGLENPIGENAATKN